MEEKLEIEKVMTNTFRYITNIHTFQVHENEVYLGVTILDEITGDEIDETLVFSTMDVLLSGISDKPYLKKHIRKYIDKI